MFVSGVESAWEPRAVCWRCERPRSVCVCAAVVPVHTRTRILILQHPRERRVPINTARLAELSFPNAVRYVGVEFASHPAVQAALASAEAPPVLLYPADDRGGGRELPASAQDRPVTLVVLDGTWWQADKLLKSNPFLKSLPCLALSPAAPSRYRIRREPRPHYVSTIEAIVAALRTLEVGDAAVDRALAPFDAMVEAQLEFAKRKERRHVRRPRAHRPDPIARWLATRRENLVVAYGEANAWPKQSTLGHAPEIVHWAALRPFSGELFEAVIAPRRALSPSFELQTGVPNARVLGGESWASFCDRWAAFLRPGDAVCTWGHFAAELVRAEGASMPERIDVRAVVRRKLGAKPGDVGECALRLGSEPVSSSVAGRTGVRLDGLAAVVRALAVAD